MTAKRYNEGKPKLGYFARSFHWALEAIARVKEFGANKYEEGNWKAGGKPDIEYLDSAARHLDLFLRGELYDQDSGCHHLGHVIWNYCALMELNYPDVPVLDKELFAKQMAYWAAKKVEAKVPTQEEWVDVTITTNLIRAANGGHFPGEACRQCNGMCNYTEEDFDE